MSACLSSPIALLAARGGPVSGAVGGSVSELAGPDLVAALAEVADPRKARGVRHRLVTVLAAAVCAVLAGARSYGAIAEWAHDLPVSVRLRLGIGRRAPSESTFRRVLRCVDAQALDQIVSGWLAEHAARQPPAASRSARWEYERSRWTARPLGALVDPTGPRRICSPRSTTVLASCWARHRSGRRRTKSPCSPHCWTVSTSPAR